jgi:hypothetical protein
VYHHVPALPDLSALFGPMGAELTPAQAHDHFRQLYRYLATSPEAVDAYARFFEILLASEGKPVLWHCTQGKDRTGVGAMLLLSALGLEEETILQEYMRTNDYMQPQLDAYAASGKTPEQVALLREVFFVFLENAKFYLDCIRVEYGSVALFLELALGVGPRQIETLEGYYLDVCVCHSSSGSAGGSAGFQPNRGHLLSSGGGGHTGAAGKAPGGLSGKFPGGGKRRPGGGLYKRRQQRPALFAG